MYHVSFNGWEANLNLNPVAIEIGTFKIYWYGILICFGIMLGLIYTWMNSASYDINSNNFTDCVIVGMVTGIIGARIYYVLFNLDHYINDPVKMLQINQGGLAVYGSIIGGLLGGCAAAKWRKLNIWATLDLGAMGFLIGQCIGRWGNFFNQEAFGSETNLPWGMISENTNNVAVHPCFLYESIWCLFGFILLHFLHKYKQKYRGQVFLCYIVWYGAGRAVIEGLRSDSLYLPFRIFSIPVRVSQLVSLILLITGVILLFINRKKGDEWYVKNFGREKNISENPG